MRPLYTRYESVGPLVTVTWPGVLLLQTGDRIKAIGREMTPLAFEAWCIFDGRGEHHEVETSQSAARGEIATPLIGRVVSSKQRQGITTILVFPTGSKAFSFQSLASQQQFLLVPELWAFLEDRADWEEQALGLYSPSEPALGFIEEISVREPSFWMQTQGRVTGAFDSKLVPAVLASIVKKLWRAERLAKKAAALDNLRAHLIACSTNEKRESALQETLEEGAMLVEHAATSVYSTLDVLAQLVNEVYGLQIPQLKCSFTALLGRPAPAVEDEPTSWKVLPTEEALYGIFEDARRDWLSKMRDVRHFVAHNGCVHEAHGPSAKAMATWQSNPEDLRSLQVLPVSATIHEWVQNTTSLVRDALQAMLERAKSICAGIDEPPDPARVRAPTSLTSVTDMLDDCVRLLRTDGSSEPNRINYLYSKLERDWRNRWSLPQFEAFVGSLTDIEDQPGAPFSAGLGTDESATRYLAATFLGQRVRMVLQARKPDRERPYLVLEPLTYPQAAERRLRLVSFSARQSGSDTGHQRAIFTAIIENASQETLEEAHIHVFHSAVRWADAAVGAVEAGQQKTVEFSTTDEVSTLLPPGGPVLLVSLLQDPLKVRVTYTTPTQYGDLWADDFVSRGGRA